MPDSKTTHVFDVLVDAGFQQRLDCFCFVIPSSSPQRRFPLQKGRVKACMVWSIQKRLEVRFLTQGTLSKIFWIAASSCEGYMDWVVLSMRQSHLSHRQTAKQGTAFSHTSIQQTIQDAVTDLN